MEFQKRAKGQRYDKSLLPLFLFQMSTALVAKDVDDVKEFPIEILEDFDGFDGFGLPCKFTRIAVTTPTHIVPAYRKAEDSTFCICQSYQYKAVRVSPK